MINMTTLYPFKSKYHTTSDFREQIAVLYAGRIADDSIDLLRSYINIGHAGAVGFDSSNPAKDTDESWERIDCMIEQDHAIGIFHTHPMGCVDFSGQDWRMMKAFAMTYGKKYLWYGMQACEENLAHFVCLHMLQNQVICYDYHYIKTQPDDMIIRLPLPPKITHNNGILRLFV